MTPTGPTGGGRRDGADRGGHRPRVDRGRRGDGGPVPEVLVVGGTATGLALAAALDRRGVAPTLLTRRSGHPTPDERVLVGPPGLDVLDRLGVGRRVRSAGDAVGAVEVAGGGSVRTERPRSGADPPVAVDRGSLCRALRSVVPDAVGREGVVAGVEERLDRLRVAFDDGDRERFDAVVGADGPTSAIRRTASFPRAEGPSLHEWSFAAGADGDRPPLRECWSADVLAATLAGGGPGVRVVARPGAVESSHPEGAVGAAAAAVGDEEVAALVDRDGDSPGYRRIRPRPGSAPVRRGRVVLCGTAARPAGFASGTDPALGLVDARGLADCLATADRVGAALGRYAARRERRAVARHRAGATLAAAAGYPPAEPGGPLAVVARRRALALGSLLREPGDPNVVARGDGP